MDDILTKHHHWYRYDIRTHIQSYLDTLITSLEESVQKSYQHRVHLFSPGFEKNMYFGERSDGACWSFTLFGSKQGLMRSPTLTFDDDDYGYIMQRFRVCLQPFTLFQQSMCELSGSISLETGLCLPEHLQGACKRFLTTRGSHERSTLRTIIEKEIWTYLYKHPHKMTLSSKAHDKTTEP